MAVRRLHLGNLPRSIRTLIFFLLIVSLIFVLNTCIMKDLLKEREVIQAEIENLELLVTEESVIKKQIKHFEQEFLYTEKRLEELKGILPTQKELPAVLKSVQQMAGSSNLKINTLTPKPVVPRSFYLEWPIEIEVTGNYDGLGTFFEKVSRAARIIGVSTLSIKGSDAHHNPTQTLTARCIATTFIFREEQPETLDAMVTGEKNPERDTGESQW